MTLNHLFELRKQYPNADQLHFIAGNTGEEFDSIVHQHRYPILVHLTGIAQLQFLGEQSQGLLVGSCVTMSRLKSQLEHAVGSRAGSPCSASGNRMGPVRCS